MIPMKLMRKKTISTQIQKNRRDTEKKLRDYAFLEEEKLLSALSASWHRGIQCGR